MSSISFAEDKPLFFDSGINGLPLIKGISKEQMKSLDLTTCDAMIGFKFCFTNEEGSELVILYAHPGGSKYDIAEIKVSFSKKDTSLPELPKASGPFKSTKGIRLGITSEELVEILGNPTSINGDIYFYEVEYNEYLLKIYNSPIYYGKYIFRSGRLFEFKYGFENP